MKYGDIELTGSLSSAISGGSITVLSPIIPATSGDLDIGSSANPFRDLYLTSSSLHLGSDIISVSDGYLLINGSSVSNSIEVSNSITTTKTLTLDELNEQWRISGTTADYSVTLPASGSVQTGDWVEFSVDNDATEIFTIVGSINGDSDYNMAARDVLKIRFNGFDWDIIYKKGNVFVSATSNSGQAVTASTEKLEYEDDIIDNHQAWTGNNTFTAPRKGFYSFDVTATVLNAANLSIRCSKNDTFYSYGAPRPAIAAEPVTHSGVIFLLKGETIDFNFTASQTRSTETIGNVLEITEID